MAPTQVRSDLSCLSVLLYSVHISCIYALGVHVIAGAACKGKAKELNLGHEKTDH